MRFRQLIIVLLLILTASLSVQATHLRAGEITITRQSCNSLTFNITITAYTNTGSPIKFGQDPLDFGDGSPVLIIPIIEATPRNDLGPNIGIVTFTTSHTYSGPGRYVVNYTEANRNQGILNMANSVNTPFYIESTVNIDPFLGCDNSPRLLVPPIDKGCTGAAWYHNPGAYDPDGDSLSYEFTVPRQGKGTPVFLYRDPNVKEFYDDIGLNYGTANEDKNGPPTFTIDPVTGTIIWDAPGAPGEYNIAFIIKEWRKVSGIWVNEGYVVRDMQIVIEDCKNKRPELSVPPDICVEADSLINADIFGTDPDYDKVKIEAFSQILNQGVVPAFPSPAKYASPPPFAIPPAVDVVKLQVTGPSIQARLQFQWQTRCAHVKQQPYQVSFKITDDPPPSKGARLVEFKTWNIRVVGPKPKWVDVHLVPSRKASLEWKPYPCTNAAVIQIWRRVESFPYTPPQCVTGIPESLGFTKIAELPISQVKYTDTNLGKGLVVGASYCYRLLAVFPLPGGGESYVSKEFCLPPVPADAPVITNVTIDKTRKGTPPDGQITVKWRPPFQINQATYPPPYRYKVLRGVGFTGPQTAVFAGTITDTTYTDTGLSTDELIYHYSVVLYNNATPPIDTSATASSVRLEAKPQFKQIELNWFADVPWSNQSQKFPKHWIYRGPEGATESQMVLIDSVNVTSGRFVYVDSGQFNQVPLSNDKVYCYRIMTKGAYGNPRIKEPLLNFSQINCAQPSDKEPPCKPELSIVAQSCDQFYANAPCNPREFSNLLTWKRSPDPLCQADIKSYNIYVATQVGADYLLYAQNVRDTFYLDLGIPSYARCYKISAVDRAGNVSKLSEEFCFDNCPHYELPNVFTPNGDNCNEVFSAFSDRAPVDENGYGTCGFIDRQELKRHCARFVESVAFTVSNRWGKEVYRYQSGGERTIYIDWDGKDDNGKDLSAGVYYYNAEVTFTVVDPKKRIQNIRGWVQIVR